MNDVLTRLQGIQQKAVRKGIRAFHLETRVYKFEDEGEGEAGLIREYGETQEMYISGYLFLTGSDAAGDYFRFDIQQSQTAQKMDYIVNQVESIVCGY